MRFNTLDDWLAWQETLHPKAIDLGLERVRAVAARMGLLAPRHTVISVAGTNGKGSSVAMLEAVLSCAGLRVGAYTSPHLWRYNERIRIDRQAVDDAALVASFARIDAARGEISLSYFEFGTLAAFDLLQRAGVDVAVLEVGLGGRLDAVNILDAIVPWSPVSVSIMWNGWVRTANPSVARRPASFATAARRCVPIRGRRPHCARWRRRSGRRGMAWANTSATDAPVRAGLGGDRA